MGDSVKPRPMKFPYTTAAQIMQFPFKHYWEKSWLFKYWLISTVICAPVFWKLQKMANTEENRKLWYEKRKKEFEGHHH